MKPYFLLLAVLLSCQSHSQSPSKTQALDKEAKEYWYAGDAEITSYNLEQARYGELHEGKAVLIFVTEPFSTKSWAKADYPTAKDTPALKLNFTKKFNTGVYPYSLMTSTFYPVDGSSSSLKISSSAQEWCGHTFMELKNKAKYELNINSYFEGESKNSNLNKSLLEDDLWSMIRLHPELLPQGETAFLPGFQYMSLTHREPKAYLAKVSLENQDGLSHYNVAYPDINRTLRITFNTDFPRQIVSWEESYQSGYGANKKMLKTTAKKIASLKTPYWQKNGNKDSHLRSKLGLEK